MTNPITAPAYGSYRWFGVWVARFMGWSEDWKAWDHDQEETVDDFIQSGLMQFYYPHAVDFAPMSHSWTFMRPTGQILTQANQQSMDMPEDFESLDGDMTYDKSEDNDYPPLQIVPEQMIRNMAYQSNYTSYPVYAAIKPKAAEGTARQMQEIMFYPIPDSTYTLRYRYNALPRPLDDDHPYPLGNKSHAEAIKGSILAVAELARGGSEGPMASAYRGLLASAVANDMRRTAELIGYNGDTSVLGNRLLNKDIRRVRDFLYTNVTYDS